MHDVVTHRVTAMVLQAGAMRVTAPDETTRVAAETLRTTGCQALDELRDLLAVLRGTPGRPGAGESRPDSHPMPDMAPLITASESVGVPVMLTITGNAALVPSAVGRTAYRIVQEALTNVYKHAPGARAEIRIDHLDNGVHLAVRSSAGVTDADPALTTRGSGSGLDGLRQRVDLVGGALEAEPTADGGFLITARLPLHVPAPHDRELVP
jgi:signal transduction histidine kinase